jgi:hypothetical protein
MLADGSREHAKEVDTSMKAERQPNSDRSDSRRSVQPIPEARRRSLFYYKYIPWFARLLLVLLLVKNRHDSIFIVGLLTGWLLGACAPWASHARALVDSRRPEPNSDERPADGVEHVY